MPAEAVQAVKYHEAAVAEAAKTLLEKEASFDKGGAREDADQTDTADGDSIDKKRQHSSDIEEPAKSLRLEGTDNASTNREKSVSPPPPALVRPDVGAVVSRCSIGGTPSRMGLMDEDVNYTFNQNNITMRTSQTAALF